MIGIYKIRNLITNDFYIGQSKNIKQRFNAHIFNAFNKNNKKLYNYHLSRAIRKYGVKNFVLEILEECNLEVLTEREVFWYETLHPTYNNIIPELNPMHDPRIKEKHQKSLETKEYREIQSKTSKEFWQRADEEVKTRMLENLKLGTEATKKPIILYNEKEFLEFESVKTAGRFLADIHQIKVASACQGIIERLKERTFKPYKGYLAKYKTPVSTISESGE